MRAQPSDTLDVGMPSSPYWLGLERDYARVRHMGRGGRVKGVNRGGRVCKKLERENEKRVVQNRGNRTKSKRERRKATWHGYQQGWNNYSECSSNGNLEEGKNKEGDERGVSFIFDNDVFFENRRREGEMDGNTVYWELKKG